MFRNFLLSAISLMATVTNAHDAITCFKESALYGGPTVDEEKVTDLDKLLLLDLDHVLTSLKVCTDRQVTKIKGVQASYGKFNG